MDVKKQLAIGKSTWHELLVATEDDHFSSSSVAVELVVEWVPETRVLGIRSAVEKWV